MTKRDKAQRIGEILDDRFPTVDIPLEHVDPFTLLVAVVLSAQTTDKLVNEVTPALFARAATPEAMAALPVDEIRVLIRRIGLTDTKAKNLKRLSELLVERHGGQVPKTLTELEALPGVGHKTASVVLNQAFGLAAFPVDTHIHRLATRWGLTSGKNVETTEHDLKRLFPEEAWGKVHLQIIYFGRQCCPALYHDLEGCPICSWAASKKRKEEERRRNLGLRRRGSSTEL
jgi:endonuclease-3